MTPTVTTAVTPRRGLRRAAQTAVTTPKQRLRPETAPQPGHAGPGGPQPGHGHGAGGGIEWEDDMVAVNRLTTTANMFWKFVDRSEGADGAAIDWRFRVGDRVKIRLVNEMDSDHPMHHPFHLHGAGRFLVLARDGVV